MLESLLRDLRYALRCLRRNPAFSLSAIAIIAVGIGSASAVFSVVDRLLFRGLPYPDSDRLVSVGINHPIMDGDFLVSNDYFHLRDLQTVFTALTSWRGAADCDLTEESPLRLTCAPVESTFLPTFGLVPVLGRNFTVEEDRPNARKVALISYALWRSRFGGSPQAIGRIIPIDGIETEVIGVLPADFELPTLQRADIVVPAAVKVAPYVRGGQGSPLRVFGRLKEGITVQHAAAALQPFFSSAMEFMPSRMQAQASIRFRSLRDFQIHDVKLASWVLFGATLAILLIVCANVANLLLARSAARQKELAVRAALGAGRSSLMRQVFSETLLLSVCGAATGCIVAAVFLRGFKLLAPAGIPRLQQAALDPRVLLFTVAMMLVCALALGLAPAAFSPRPEILSTRRGGSSARTGLRRVQTAGDWKNAGQVVTADIVAGPQRYPNAMARQQFFERLVERLRLNPAVTAVAVSDTVPPSGFVHSGQLAGLHVPGERPREAGEGGIVAWRQVSPDYFRALGIPILRGRAFDEAERTSAHRTMVISATLARLLFQGREPLGSIVRLRSDEYTVIGIAADVDNAGIPGHSDPEYYILWRKISDPALGVNVPLVVRSLHQYDGEAFVSVRSNAPSGAVANWIRTEAAAIDATVPVTTATLEQRVRGISERPRFSAFLMSLFAIIGLLLAASGLYGLISFLVVQRTQEIGVRMALGATPGRIARLVVSDALRWTAIGTAFGLGGAAATARALRGILYGIPAQNPLLFTAAAVLLFAIACAASLFPSLRASRIDPVRALHHE